MRKLLRHPWLRHPFLAHPHLRRGLLYGAAALIAAMGWRWHKRLASDAEGVLILPPGPAIFAGTIGDRRLGEAISASGIDRREAERIAAAMARVVDARRLHPNDGYRITVSSTGAFQHMTLSRGLKRGVVTVDADGQLRARGTAVSAVEARKEVAGVISGSLWASMERQGAAPEVILEFAELFSSTVDFLTEVRDGDKFAAIWMERRSPEGRSLGSTILAASYAGTVAGKAAGFRFEGDYYDAEGQSLRRMFLRAPLAFARVSSYFGRRRRHPILRINRPHHGTDYAAPRGTPISSVAAGRAAFVGRKGGYGNVVIVRHDGTYETFYAHLSRFGPRLRAGSPVDQGQVVGYVGSTGLATGPHLHFELRKQGRPVDFLRANLPFARSVPKAKRAAFSSELERLQAELASLGAS